MIYGLSKLSRATINLISRLVLVKKYRFAKALSTRRVTVLLNQFQFQEPLSYVKKEEDRRDS